MELAVLSRYFRKMTSYSLLTQMSSVVDQPKDIVVPLSF